MPVHKVIYRWDFSVNVELFDRPGVALRSLGLNEDGQWQRLSENHNKRTFALSWQADDESAYRTLTFTPTSLVSSIEWRAGVPIARLLDQEDLVSLFTRMDEARKLASISTIGRAGIRFYYLGEIAERKTKDATGSALSLFCAQGCNPLSNLISGVLGPTKDMMLTLVGESDDGTNYSCRTGPYFSGESEKFFEKVAPESEDAFKSNFMCDADFSEHNFALTVTSKKWASSSISKLSLLVDVIQKNLGGVGHG